MEKNYDACVDIWSVGCVFAELLNSLEPNKKDGKSMKDKILFPGKSCYPLSPDNSYVVGEDGQSEEQKISSRD